MKALQLESVPRPLFAVVAMLTAEPPIHRLEPTPPDVVGCRGSSCARFAAGRNSPSASPEVHDHRRRACCSLAHAEGPILRGTEVTGPNVTG